MALPNSSNINTVGASGKVNYQNLPPSDLTTDWDNTTLGPAVTDIANSSLTAPRFQINFTLAASTGALVLNNWYAVWQNATSTAPILAQTTTGVFTITLPASVSDQYSQSIGIASSIPVNLTTGQATLAGTTFGFVNVSCSANVITLNVGNSGGSPANLVGTVCNVWAR